jgi:Raf kinase inhibitor-like YbhB/YbcL family protein
MAFTVSSPSFVAGGDIPVLFSCDGDDLAPHLMWTGAPRNTQSFVLVMEDPDAPDAPSGTFTHWLVFDIPADCTDLPSGSRSDGVGLSGLNSSGKLGYMGPCPPSGTHRYVFRLVALDLKTLSLIAGASRQAVERMMADHTIATAELLGHYTHRTSTRIHAQQ